MEHYADPLISVDQLWDELGFDTRFRDLRHFIRADGLTLPFRKERNAYRWRAGVGPGELRHSEKVTAALGKSLKSRGIHSASSNAHLEELSADAAGMRVNRRLHLGVDRIRLLPSICIDAPSLLARTRQVHKGGAYRRLWAGAPHEQAGANPRVFFISNHTQG